MLVKQLDNRQRKNLPVNQRLQILIFIAAFAILISRRPDALFNAQFWAEDGHIWYADAYNIGIINSLILPSVGYFQTVSRLTASLTQFFPLESAPLVSNLIAIVIQLLPIILITSSRFSILIPSLPTRLFLALLYLAIPNCYELHGNITNAQWHQALLACMVILATPSRSLSWRFFDFGVILLSGLSGPFSVLLTPIALLRWWLRRRKWSLILFLCLGITALVQGTAIFLTAHSTRVQASLGATPVRFLKLVAGRVFLGALIGQEGYARLSSPSGWYTLLAILVAIVGIAVFVYCLLQAPLELRLFSIFAALIFATSLLSPMIAGDETWVGLLNPGGGGRYWFIPMLAFVTQLTWMARPKSPHYLGQAARVALVTMLIGIILDWSHPTFADLNFRKYAEEFRSAPVGTKVKIPINPPPHWFMELTKH